MAKSRDSAMRISRKGMLVWIGLILFIAAWMFVLGILVGRGMAPVNLEAGKLEQELAALKAKMLQQEASKVEAQVSGQGDGAAELGFYEALKDPKAKTQFRPVPKPPPPVPKPAVAQKPPVKRPVAPKPKPVPKPEPAPKPKAKLDPTPRPAPSPRVGSSSGKFTVQVAAVRESRGAERLVGELRKKGFQAYQIRTEVTGRGVWYRVRVGAFADRAGAVRTAEKLKAAKYGAMVVSAR